MIPQRLTLRNFLSYREATLDFRGLHTACVCGANGAGKSSLLEAIAWVVWGESRANTEDDIIHIGAQEAQVDFIFISQQHTYRILRTRHRNQATGLEFQVAIDPAAEQPLELSFRSLTAKGVRATQQLILSHLKLDYETFVNSAYLRQGRADEFMLKRASDRKQILADLLKLSQYDDLAERAKDQARQFKGQIDLLERSLAATQTQLQQRDRIAQERANLEAILVEMQQQQAIESDQLRHLHGIQQQRHTWQQQFTWERQQQRILTQDCHRLQQELTAAHQQQRDLEALLQQESAIVAGYSHFQALQAEDDRLSTQFKHYQHLQQQQQHAQQQHADRAAALQRQLHPIQAQIEALMQQEAETQQSLSKAADLETALTSLHQARSQLSQLDRLQTQATPLFQRRQHVQTQIDRASTRLSARLDELRASVQQLQTQQARQPDLHHAVSEISDRIDTLEQRRAYQQQVLDKGMERRHFMERLQEQQRDCETRLSEVEQKILLLREGTADARKEGVAVWAAEGGLKVAESPIAYITPQAILSAPFPPCPLCDRPLDEHHWQRVLEKHQTEHQAILDQLWVIREQLSASEREIQVLRQEYRQIDRQLTDYAIVLERRGQLQAQLQTSTQQQTALDALLSEVRELEQALDTADYAIELQEELDLLDRTLTQLNYDERDHALMRGEVDRWRWADIRQAELRQAQRRQAQIAQRLPELHEQAAELERQLTHLHQEATHHLTQVEQQIVQTGYSPDQHDQLRAALRQAQPWQLRYQEFCRSRQTYPHLRQRSAELAQALQERHQHLHSAQSHLDALTQQLEQTPEVQPQIQALEQAIQQRRSRLDEHLAQLGRLQQQQQQLEALDRQQTDLTTQLQTAQKQYRVHHELTLAFGRNGIQTLMIENVLPQLEAETNHILGRLSANQLHVQFVTQRSARREQNAKLKSQSKLIETLDILIADARGTRPYETYSGGEAFRVNFAIRLALSRLLAQRSGTALQLLIIDEGFGTQDEEGCDRLIAAINAIASDFACILTVTHVPHFKEAFQSRIEVFKTENGSQISLSM